MNKKLIAITGKTGVGKTYLLKKYNYKNTIFLDEYVKNVLYLENTNVFKKVTKEFGNIIILNKKINTSKLGKIVLNDKKKLEFLTNIVNKEIKKMLKNLNNDNFIVEIPTYIKYENYFKKLFDKVILITSSNPIMKNKFTYMNKKIDLITEVNIQYDFLINRDKKNTQITFFKILDMLLSFKQ